MTKPKAPADSESLILSGSSLMEFDSALNDLRSLTESSLITLRCDLRCRSVYYVDRIMVDGDYFLETDGDERDHALGMLDSDLVKSDELMSEVLTSNDKNYILDGLSKLINELLVSGSDSLNLINAQGVRKMECNIIVLQQVLKSIVLEPAQVIFNRATTFYDTLLLGPNVFLDQVKKGETSNSYDEGKILLRLMHNEAIHKHEQAGRREAAISAKNVLHDQLIQLHDYYWGSDKVEK